MFCSTAEVPEVGHLNESVYIHWKIFTEKKVTVHRHGKTEMKKCIGGWRTNQRKKKINSQCKAWSNLAIATMAKMRSFWNDEKLFSFLFLPWFHLPYLCTHFFFSFSFFVFILTSVIFFPVISHGSAVETYDD